MENGQRCFHTSGAYICQFCQSRNQSHSSLVPSQHTWRVKGTSFHFQGLCQNHLSHPTFRDIGGDSSPTQSDERAILGRFQSKTSCGNIRDILDASYISYKTPQETPNKNHNMPSTLVKLKNTCLGEQQRREWVSSWLPIFHARRR